MMSPEAAHAALHALYSAKRAMEDERDRRAGGRFKTIFPDDGDPALGQFKRELYQKHLKFFEAGATKKERLFMAANRVGKSRGGAFEVTCHTTGRYPHWWKGRRFDHPVDVWACGTTNETTRDIVQAELLGAVDPKSGTAAMGRGMIPADAIVHHTRKTHGLPGSIQTVWVRHVSGGTSAIHFKTYEQGRKSFEGTAIHVIWDDEEPPADIYTEQLYRTATVRGITIVTFTPLQGMSDVVKGFLTPENPAAAEFKWFIQAGWNDVPHIPEEERRALLATTPPHQIKARTEGTPSLGAGAIFPIPEAEIKIKRFELPKYYRRGYGADHGWNWFGAIWMAYDPETTMRYVYDCYKRSQAEPPIHAQAIKDKSKVKGAAPDWRMPGVMDAADIDKTDGRQFVEKYRGYGLDLELPNKAVETGLQEMWTLLSTGKLKVFDDLEPWFEEYRIYHRNEKGVIVKVNDHVMDPTRYVVMADVMDRMKVPAWTTAKAPAFTGAGGANSWMG